MWLTAPDDDGTACVPITKQPASDNPFLKNHKIQVHEYIVYLDFIWAFYLCSKCWCLVYFTCSFIFRWSLTTIQRDSLMTTKCLLQSQEKKTYISLSYDISMVNVSKEPFPWGGQRKMISWEQVHSNNMARRRNELSHFLNLLNLTSLTKEVTRWAKFFFFWFLDLICIFFFGFLNFSMSMT